MADVISLRTARKARARADKEMAAAANRAAFGRTKAEKRVAADDQARRDAVLDNILPPATARAVALWSLE